jgi:hypothetical protein
MRILVLACSLLVLACGGPGAQATPVVVYVTPSPTPTLAAIVPTPSPTAMPTATPTVTPSPPPTPTPGPTRTPTPTSAFLEFDDDTYSIPDEMPAGTYRNREETFGCYWARLKGFSGALGDIIANDFTSGFAVVTIKKSDQGFESNDCGPWSTDLSRVTDSDTEFGEGTFIVGIDIKPGTYRSSEGDGCYWARLRGFAGTLGEIIANDFRSSGHATVTIKSSDKGFKSSNCGTWIRQ